MRRRNRPGNRSLQLTSHFSLDGKVALVTGGARGIGRAVGEAFLAARAARVVCADILETDAPADERLDIARLDVTSETAWRALIERILAEHGKLDILVNNAGVLTFGPLADAGIEDFQRMLNVNVVGTLLGMQAVIPGMKSRRQGCIVNISSASGMLPSNFVGAYAAGKYAVRGLTRAAALEWGLHGVRVNSVHPGGVNTQMTNPAGRARAELDPGYDFVPLQRGCEPEEIAGGVTYLASDAAAYCNGTELVIDGGMTAGVYFPRLPGSPGQP